MAKRPLLSWKLEDYEKNNIEPPENLKDSPTKSEAELMDEEEIRSWFQDTYKTLTVIKGDDKELFVELRDNFILDIQYLAKIGIISEEILDDLLDDELLR